MAVLNQILSLNKCQKQPRKAIFYNIAVFKRYKHNSEHSAATSAVVFWTDFFSHLHKRKGNFDSLLLNCYKYLFF